MNKYEVHCFTAQNLKDYGNKFPENSYFYDTEEDVIACLCGLIRNKISGIYLTELRQNDFNKIDTQVVL